MEMAPASGMTRPTMLRISVLLPAPLGPSNPRHSAWRSSRVMPSTAVVWPNRFTSAAMRKGGAATLAVAGKGKVQLSLGFMTAGEYTSHGRSPDEFGCNQKSSNRSEEHTSELQSLAYLVCRLLL